MILFLQVGHRRPTKDDMGISLYFRSVGPVSSATEVLLREESRQPRHEQPWVLCEPPHFYSRDASGRLLGGTKLNLHPWADEWQDAAQVETDVNDLQMLLRLLTDWSAKYGIDWDLEVEDTHLGRITDGACPADLEETLQAFTGVSEHLAEDYPHWPGKRGNRPGGAGKDHGQRRPAGESPADDASDGPRLRIWPEPED
jgi:hypothetical protein